MKRLIILLFVCGLSAPAIAKDRAVGISKRAVDMISQKNGSPLLGSIMDKGPDGSMRIAVQRTWLQTADPERFRKLINSENTFRKDRLKTLLQRVKTWMAERAEDKGLIFALKPEQRRLETELAKANNEAAADDKPDPNGPQFFILTVKQNNVRKVTRKSAQHRQVAAFAWRERLKNVETRSVQDLVKELRDRKITPGRNEMPDLGDRLPPKSESEEEFAVRQAMFEYQFRKPLDFQGTGGLLLKAGEGAANVDPGQLLGQLLDGQGSAGLAGLLDSGLLGKQAGTSTSNSGLEKAKKSAEAAGVKGFRTVTMQHNLSQMTVTVTSKFYARISEDNWKLVHTLDVPYDASNADPDAAAQIKEDPRIKSILGIFESTGIGDGAVEKAMKFGAATQQAQKNADGKFREFLDKYIRRVDSPPLPSDKKE